MQLCEEKKCTGCMACFNVCKHDAISVKEKHGFLYPIIDKEKCVNCGLCSKVCPELQKVDRKEPMNKIAYAVFNLDKQQRDASSSGGVFITLARYIINMGGVIYGAAYDANLSVNHIRISKLEDIHFLQGSKYVQSNIGSTYRLVENDLNAGLFVLFSGVSCQIAGLRKYLRKGYEKLYMVEVLCHGGASPVAFRNHLLYISKQNHSKVTDVNFRYKTEERCQNLKYVFANGKSLILSQPLDDIYYKGFLGGVLLRNSCFQCSHVGINRCGDILIADFWGVDRDKIVYPDKMTYVSLVLVFTDKGADIFKACHSFWSVVERPLAEAVNGNLALKRCIPYSKWNSRFFDELDSLGYEKAAEHCLSSHFNIKEALKGLLGPTITKIVLRLLRR